MKILSKKAGLLFLIALSLLLFFLDIICGPSGLLFIGKEGSGLSGNIDWSAILFYLRLPKAAAAFLCGSSLALAGLLLQTFFKNPLAGPDVMGIASGAGFGAAISILILPAGFPGIISSSGFAAIGALLVTFLLLSFIKKTNNILITLIAGLLIGYFIQSVTGIMLRFSSSQSVKIFIDWSSGSFRNISLEKLLILIPVTFISFFAAFIISRKCDIYLLGDEYALSMGLNLKKFRTIVVLITSILTGIITSFCGPISFIGIAAPHFCRFFLRTDKHFLLIPGTILSGASIALLSDIVTTLPGPGYTLPLNSVTAIIGCPIIISVLIKNSYER